VFHSYNAAHMTRQIVDEVSARIGTDYVSLNPGPTYPSITMPASMIAAAAANHVWISCANSSAPISCWESFVVRADGIVVARMPRHDAGCLITTVDTEQDLYDGAHVWRERAIEGVFHSGTLVHDSRSTLRSSL
jgi:deaminated glutathione amidase